MEEADENMTPVVIEREKPKRLPGEALLKKLHKQRHKNEKKYGSATARSATARSATDRKRRSKIGLGSTRHGGDRGGREALDLDAIEQALHNIVREF